MKDCAGNHGAFELDPGLDDLTCVEPYCAGSPIPRSISQSGNRISRGLQQRPCLREREADDVRIAARDLTHIDLAIALQGITAGLATPFAVAGVIVDLFVRQAVSVRSSSRRAAPDRSARDRQATPVSTRWRLPDSSFMHARSVASSSTFGRMRRPTATTVSAASTRPSGRRTATAAAFSRASEAHGRVEARPAGRFVDVGGHDLIGHHANAREQVQPRAACGSEDEGRTRGALT